MPRTTGARNLGFHDQRNALIGKARERLARRDGPNASLRQLAAAAGVSVATLRHYFKDRKGLVHAVLQRGRQLGEVHLARTRAPAESDIEGSMLHFLQEVAGGWQRGIGAVHSVGLVEGLKSDAAGLNYLVDILEPTLQALEKRLATHIERGDMRAADTRHAALWLLSPILLALLHQHELGGRKCRPLDVDALLKEHARVFAQVYRPELQPRNEAEILNAAEH